MGGVKAVSHERQREKKALNTFLGSWGSLGPYRPHFSRDKYISRNAEDDIRRDGFS